MEKVNKVIDWTINGMINEINHESKSIMSTFNTNYLDQTNPIKILPYSK